ncbi:MAG: hypothetical protein QF692_01790 [Alphaproteobacteria bacterium]|jgi:hypothetical protein|nr:hypothetical protein [Alphaproteobacteria bacterium]
MFEGFEDHLRDIIRNTSHYNDHDDEKRYHDVMKALFGAHYKADPRLPAGLCESDILDIIEESEKTKNLEGTIKAFLKKRRPQIVAKDDDEKWQKLHDQEEALMTDLKAISKHIERHRDIYQWSFWRRDCERRQK